MPVPTVLFVENHARFATIVVRQFLADYHVTLVADMATARAKLVVENFDVMLVDYDLDDGKGTELALVPRLAKRARIHAQKAWIRARFLYYNF